jgi:hypothetical protein
MSVMFIAKYLTLKMSPLSVYRNWASALSTYVYYEPVRIEGVVQATLPYRPSSVSHFTSVTMPEIKLTYFNARGILSALKLLKKFFHAQYMMFIFIEN